MGTAAVAGLAAALVEPPPDRLTDTDFANYWIASQLVLQGRVMELFGSQATYFAAMLEQFGPNYPWRAWSYPPHYLLLVWPLALLGFTPSMVVFQSATLALYLLSVRRFAGRLDVRVIAFLGPFIAINLAASQNGFLTGALLLGALALRYERPTGAGLLAGILTVKPQLGLLLPALLVVERRWRMVLVAGVSTFALVGVSIVAFGANAWRGFWSEVVPHQRLVMDEGTGIFLNMMPGVFGALRSLGVDAPSALVFHLMLAVPVLAISFAAWRRIEGPLHRACILVVATPLVIPYSLLYDLGAFVAVVAMMGTTPGWSNSPRSRTVLLAGALLPVAALPLAILGAPIAPLVLAATWVMALRTRTPVPSGSATPRSEPGSSPSLGDHDPEELLEDPDERRAE